MCDSEALCRTMCLLSLRPVRNYRHGLFLYGGGGGRMVNHDQQPKLLGENSPFYGTLFFYRQIFHLFFVFERTFKLVIFFPTPST